MRTGVKVILIVSLCLVVLAAAGVGGIVYYVSRHKGEFIEAGRKAMDEGHEFGARTDNEGCVTEAVARAKREQGFSAAISHNLFLRSCLEASRESPAFCAGVPGRTEFMKGAQWQQQKCKDAGLSGDTYCGQLFMQVQQFCEGRQTTGR